MRPYGIDDVLDLLEENARHRYGLSDVSQLEHAEQAARLAAAEGQPDAVVIACLLHDIGHLLASPDRPAAADRGIDDKHEITGARILAGLFGAEVAEPVRLHVAAKRYLCATDDNYFGKLSADSVRSLVLQGGPMTAAECKAFEGEPYYRQAVAVRIYDDRAKVAGAVVPPYGTYVPMIRRLAGADATPA